MLVAKTVAEPVEALSLSQSKGRNTLAEPVEALSKVHELKI